jgi:hypothetical protein
MGDEPADEAKERTLRLTISFINMPAGSTFPARIAWIYEDHRHAGYLRFIGYFGLQVGKGPRRMLASRSFSDRYPISDPDQIFQGNSEAGVFSFRNNLLAYFVVDVVCHALLFPPALLQQSFGRFCTLALQPGSKFGVSFAETIKVVSGVSLAARIGGDIFNPQINPKKSFNINRLWRLNFACGKQIKLTLYQSQIAFTALELEQFKLTLSGQKGNPQPTGNSPDANGLPVKPPTENPGVVGNRPVRVKLSPCLFVQLVSIGNFGDATYHHLSGQAKLLFNFAVGYFLKPKLIKGALPPGYVTDVITGGVSLFYRFKQGLMLFRGGLQLHFGGKFHRYIPWWDRDIVARFQPVDKYIAEVLGQFLHWLEASGGIARSL